MPTGLKFVYAIVFLAAIIAATYLSGLKYVIAFLVGIIIATLPFVVSVFKESFSVEKTQTTKRKLSFKTLFPVAGIALSLCALISAYRTIPPEHHFYDDEIAMVWGPHMLITVLLFGMYVYFAVWIHGLYKEGKKRLEMEKDTTESLDDHQKQEAQPAKGELVPMHSSNTIQPTEIIPPQRFDEGVIRQQLEQIRDSKTNLVKYFVKARTIYTLQAHIDILDKLAEVFGVETKLLKQETERFSALHEREIAAHVYKRTDLDIQIIDKEKERTLAQIEADIARARKEKALHDAEAQGAGGLQKSGQAKEPPPKSHDEILSELLDKVLTTCTTVAESYKKVYQIRDEFKALGMDEQDVQMITDELMTLIREKLG